MDRRERFSDPEEALRIALEGGQSQIWTALPSIVVKFDPVRQTCDVQPTISTTVRQQDGSFQDLNMPVLLDCPIQFVSGGGATLTFPIAVNDEVLVVFASRCIDSWWSQGGVRGQAEFRMHDLSDGFVLPGIKSQPNKFTVSGTAVQLRTNDGAAFIELNPTTHDVAITTSGKLTINTTGDVTANVSGATSIHSTGAVIVESAAKTTVKGSAIDLNAGAMKGVVQGDCACAFTGLPHAQISGTVKASV